MSTRFLQFTATGEADRFSAGSRQELNAGINDILGEFDENNGGGLDPPKKSSGATTAAGRNKPATQTDLEDMDNKLFESFSQSTRTTRSNSNPSTRAMETNPLTQEQLDTPPSSEVVKKSTEKKKEMTETDDLLNLLREDEEDNSKKKSRPKFQAKSHQSGSMKTPTSTPGTTALEHKTSTESLKTLPLENEERPKSRHRSEHNRKEKTSLQSVSARSSDATGLTLDGLGRGGGREETGNKMQNIGKRGGGGGERGRKSTDIGVDAADEDDLLSGMGLDDGATSPPNTRRITDSIPQKKEIEKPIEKHKISSKSAKGEEQEENYLFGGYTPSISGSRRRGLPPMVGMKRDKENTSSLSHEPTLGSSTGPESTETPIHKPSGEISHTARNQPKASTSETGSGKARTLGKKSVRFSEEKTELKLSPSQSEETNEQEKNMSRNQNLHLLQNESEPQKSDKRRDLDLENSEQRLEHPVFPWQDRQQRRRRQRDAEELKIHKNTNPFAQSMLHPEPQQDGENGHVKKTPPEKLFIEDQERNSKTEQLSDRHHQINHPFSEQRGSSQIESLKANVNLLENELKVLEQKKQSLTDKLKMAEVEKREQLGDLKSKEHELTLLMEELKAKVYGLERERDHLNSLLDTVKTHNTEEQTTLKKSHSARIKAIEESFQRREESWKEEREAETVRQKQRLQELEREKTDSLLALKKKMESLELTKNNEISQLQETHRSTIADIKTEHEVELNRLKDHHRLEIEALKSAHSHTQRLTELSGQLEELVGKVSGLQTRVDQTHQKTQNESQQNSYTHQQHLKMLEDRLSKQCRDVESERELLRSLVVKLDSQLIQYTQIMEQERWTLQQESARLEATKRTLEEQRSAQLTKLEQERREMTESKERFLAEQQKLLSECLNERHSLAAERAQLKAEKSIFIETEKKHTQRKQTRELELEAQLAKVIEEKDLLSREKSQLQQTEARLKSESDKLEQERLAMEKERTSLLHGMDLAESSGQEANRLSLSAVAMQRESEEMKEATLRLQAELAEQAEALKRQRQELEKREDTLVSDRLTFARECREHQEKQRSVLETTTITNPSPILTSTGRKSSHYPDLSKSLPHLSHSRDHHHH